MADRNICEVSLLDSITESTNVLVEENGVLNKLNLYDEINPLKDEISNVKNQLNAQIQSISVSGTLDSDGFLAVGLSWSNSIPIGFLPIDRAGWIYDFSNKSNDSTVYLYVHGLGSVATGNISGTIYYIAK